MTAFELQRALSAMPPRAAQTLMFRCLEMQTAEECAALYGIGLPQWNILFLEAARALTGESSLLGDAERRALADELYRQCELLLTPGAPEPATLDPRIVRLAALVHHREEVRRLIVEAERTAAQSPARRREGWLRRAAVVAIIGVSLFVWMRDRDKPPEPPTRNR
jgi:hypothetical protein